MSFMQALRDRWTRPTPWSASASIRSRRSSRRISPTTRTRCSPSAATSSTPPRSYACAFKPQIAHFAALGAEDALQRLIAHIHAAHPGIPVILDAKRGDIGSTAQHYAREAFDRYAADAVTANPYLGPRFGAAVPRSRRRGRGDPVPHVEPGRRRPAGPACVRRPPAVPARRRKSRARVERQRQLRAGGRRDLAGATARSARDRRRHAVPRAGRRRAGRRRRSGGAQRDDRTTAPACWSVRRARSSTPRRATTSPKPPRALHATCATRSTPRADTDDSHARVRRVRQTTRRCARMQAKRTQRHPHRDSQRWLPFFGKPPCLDPPCCC